MKRVWFMHIFFVVFIAWSLWGICNESDRWMYLDFDDAMCVHRYSYVLELEKTKNFTAIHARDLFNFFKSLYEDDQTITLAGSELRIPKIIHQIWIGDVVPEEFKSFQESWIRYHPDWQYKLWTQADIPHLSLYNKDLCMHAKNPGELSDMLRYEILYQWGGVYVDMDFECLKPLDILHHRYDFYVGIQPLDSEVVQLGIGIIGSVPRHPLLMCCIGKIRERQYEDNITIKTGPLLCTKVFFEMAHSCNYMRNVALPAYYFYPLGCEEYDLKYDEWVQHGAFAVHHWAKSWLYPEFRRLAFRTIKNCRERM